MCFTRLKREKCEGSFYDGSNATLGDKIGLAADFSWQKQDVPVRQNDDFQPYRMSQTSELTTKEKNMGSIFFYIMSIEHKFFQKKNVTDKSC